MLFKNQHPKQGQEACKENASSCHLSRSKHSAGKTEEFLKTKLIKNAKFTHTGKKV